MFWHPIGQRLFPRDLKFFEFVGLRVSKLKSGEFLFSKFRYGSSTNPEHLLKLTNPIRGLPVYRKITLPNRNLRTDSEINEKTIN